MRVLATAASAEPTLVTQWTSALPSREQRADAAAVVLVGGDEEQHEGRVGHGSNSDSMPTLKVEQ